MREVTKDVFEKFIEDYRGPGKLCSHEINFTTPTSTIYCDFGLHPEMNPGLERIGACLVAEHVHPNIYLADSSDKYYIYTD